MKLTKELADALLLIENTCYIYGKQEGKLGCESCPLHDDDSCLVEGIWFDRKDAFFEKLKEGKNV